LNVGGLLVQDFFNQIIHDKTVAACERFIGLKLRYVSFGCQNSLRQDSLKVVKRSEVRRFMPLRVAHPRDEPLQH
jgi:hypothetical protein